VSDASKDLLKVVNHSNRQKYQVNSMRVTCEEHTSISSLMCEDSTHSLMVRQLDKERNRQASRRWKAWDCPVPCASQSPARAL